MDHYLDIKVLPDPELSENFLINSLFAKLHRILGQQADGKIGISLPRHDKTPGPVIRLHGTAQDIEKLMQTDWLGGMKAYCQQSDLLPVPGTARYRTVRRVQAKSAYNKRKRSVNKGWLTPEQAEACIPDTQQKTLRLPFMRIKSLSNGNPMRVYIEHGALSDTPVNGVFNAYGLSKEATIPWF